MTPFPNRPHGTSRKAIFLQWAYDSLKELQPQSGPGVFTDVTTRGVFRRMVWRASGEGEVCSLPVLDPTLFYFGYWYDSLSQLHLWNTTRVEHDGISWARFTNPGFVAGQRPIEARTLADSDLSACLLLGSTNISQVDGPFGYPMTNGTTRHAIGVGQYWDHEIISPRRNCAVLFDIPPVVPPTQAGGGAYPTSVATNGSLYYDTPFDPFDPRGDPVLINPGPLPF